ncbi:NAD(P)-dependent oxidoreductase [Jiangella mangrovi]|uniref:3-hydroxyisobutyrate dehydrogenase-like beta-hydroxyacid dehydrogenase n=1 Tax=Jiangella mangrovi TaxID=1524084 RepID=A0A7W9GUJ9_9ACTN|nr:NAD(P)-dependent oxidoreductase [Jiangella mangrovi]MBB5790207.1 3-hydroxyisobutyrate dehydrogenase-like beta-hydroxyacid dehydrogenase [Jiangella mangrovi]
MSMGTITKDAGIAVIGLGKMGFPMARNLAAAGYRVVVFDIDADRAAALAEHGVEAAASPAEAAARSAAALVVVGFDNEVQAVVSGENGLLTSPPEGYVIAVCSTVEPRTSTDAAELAKARGAHVVDASLCRGEPSAEDGSLLVMCGGEDEHLDFIQPVLEVVGSDVHRLGGVGAGQVGKMLNNFLLWNSVVANYEAMRLGARLGVDLEPLRQSLLQSSGNNWALETWLRSRPMPWAEKDMRIMMQYADEAALPMPLAGLIRETIKEIKIVKNAWTEGGGRKSSMDDFTRAHI